METIHGHGSPGELIANDFLAKRTGDFHAIVSEVVSRPMFTFNPGSNGQEDCS
jgi:hypothetical protein